MSNYDLMVKAYLEWHDMAKRSFEGALKASIPEDYGEVHSVVVCGMGGSGIVGDYIAMLRDVYGGKPVAVVKSHMLPKWVDEFTLVATVSYSGNTLETIICFDEAVKRKAKVLVVAGGGELAKKAEKHSTPLALVEKGPAARVSFPSLLYSLLAVLLNLKLLDLPKDHVYESISLIRGARNLLEHARSIAEKLLGEQIVIATCSPYEGLAIRVKNELAENAKVPSIVWSLPESLHNDIEYGLPPKSKLLAISTGDRVCSNLLRALVEVLSLDADDYVRLELPEANVLGKLIWGTLYAGLLSLELARLRGVDPLETPRIKKFRSMYSDLFK